MKTIMVDKIVQKNIKSHLHCVRRLWKMLHITRQQGNKTVLNLKVKKKPVFLVFSVLITCVGTQRIFRYKKVNKDISKTSWIFSIPKSACTCIRENKIAFKLFHKVHRKPYMYLMIPKVPCIEWIRNLWFKNSKYGCFLNSTIPRTL